ncbi:MAG: hypothetical protein ACK5P7_00630 [Bdellovibrio sp.]|jgi:hypothetical protein
MKFLLATLTVIVGMSLMGPAAQAAPVNTNMCMREPGVKGGDATPWPWGSEIRFPWTRIQGIWSPLAQDCNSYFVFKVVKQSTNGEKLVRVLQYNPQTCEKISEGVGFELSDVIYASMAAGSQSYDISIRAFDTSVLEGQTSGSGASISSPMSSVNTYAAAKSVVVVSLYPKFGWDKRTSYQLEKIRTNTALICREE